MAVHSPTTKSYTQSPSLAYLYTKFQRKNGTPCPTPELCAKSSQWQIVTGNVMLMCSVSLFGIVRFVSSFYLANMCSVPVATHSNSTPNLRGIL